MKKRNNRKTASGSGRFGALSPCAVEMTGQFFAPLSNDCPMTAFGLDPRFQMQKTTGLNISKHIKSIMEKGKNKNLDTDTEEVGIVSPGMKGTVDRVHFVLLSEDREQEQEILQVERMMKATETKEIETNIFMSASEGDNSDSSEWLFSKPRISNKMKRNKQNSSEEGLQEP